MLPEGAREAAQAALEAAGLLDLHDGAFPPS